MLKKTDNPQLFAAVAAAYQRVDKSFTSITAKELTDEQLAKITTLTINPTSMREFNIQSLAGIEQLVNLTHLSIRGQDSRAHSKDFEGAFERARIFDGYDLERDLRFYNDEYNCCQISDEDIARLSTLSRLESLDLSNQRAITGIDVSHFPNLTRLIMSDCESLKSVKGLSQLSVIKNPDAMPDKYAYDKSSFEFGGCYRLKEIDDFLGVVDLMSQAGYTETHLHLPTGTYASLYRQYQKQGIAFKDELEKYTVDSPVDWVETSKGNVRAVHNSSQMRMATNRIEDTLRTVCQDSPQDDFVKVARWYRWICDNVRYDHQNLDIEKNGTPGQREKVKHKIRSSFTTLWSKQAVCVGISNLFNYGVNLMGYTAAPVSVSAGSLNTDSRAVISDHQISALFLAQENGPDIPVYCDPTWDLISERGPQATDLSSRYFCKTYDEMSTDHRFELAFYQNGMGAASIQSALSAKGCLKTPPPVQATTQGM